MTELQRGTCKTVVLARTIFGVNMLLFNPLIVILPAAVVGIALLRYASMRLQRRRAEQEMPVPVRVKSRESFDRKDI